MKRKNFFSLEIGRDGYEKSPEFYADFYSEKVYLKLLFYKNPPNSTEKMGSARYFYVSIVYELNLQAQGSFVNKSILPKVYICLLLICF
jgi:hypothetical protein